MTKKRRWLAALAIGIGAGVMPSTALGVYGWHSYAINQWFDSSIDYFSTAGNANRKANHMYNVNGSYTPVKVWQIDTSGNTLSGSVVTMWGDAQWGIAGQAYYTTSRCKVPTPYSGYAYCESYKEL
jgi:hypothetical protein